MVQSIGTHNYPCEQRVIKNFIGCQAKPVKIDEVCEEWLNDMQNEMPDRIDQFNDITNGTFNSMISVANNMQQRYNYMEKKGYNMFNCDCSGIHFVDQSTFNSYQNAKSP